jgi:hypothetical protein
MGVTDYQVGGNHYRTMAIQPITFIQANGFEFCEGNVIKYVTRWRQKGGIEDLRKAAHYLDMIQAKAGLGNDKLPGLMNLEIRANHFIEANGIKNPEAGVIRHVTLYHITRLYIEIEAAGHWMVELLQTALKEQESDHAPR